MRVLNEDREHRIVEGEGFFNPVINYVENDKKLEIFVGLPGLSKNEVSVCIVDNVIEIVGEKQDRFIKAIGGFEKKISIGPNYYSIIELTPFIDSESLTCSMHNGLLLIELKKKSPLEDKKKTINIK